jgi:hypothetical protein
MVDTFCSSINRKVHEQMAKGTRYRFLYREVMAYRERSRPRRPRILYADKKTGMPYLDEIDRPVHNPLWGFYDLSRRKRAMLKTGKTNPAITDGMIQDRVNLYSEGRKKKYLMRHGIYKKEWGTVWDGACENEYEV